jgi:hypothetical protein
VRYTSLPSRRKTIRPNHSSTPKSAEKRSVQIVYHGTSVQPIRSAYVSNPGGDSRGEKNSEERPRPPRRQALARRPSAVRRGVLTWGGRPSRHALDGATLLGTRWQRVGTTRASERRRKRGGVGNDRRRRGLSAARAVKSYREAVERRRRAFVELSASSGSGASLVIRKPSTSKRIGLHTLPPGADVRPRATSPHPVDKLMRASAGRCRDCAARPDRRVDASRSAESCGGDPCRG